MLAGRILITYALGAAAFAMFALPAHMLGVSLIEDLAAVMLQITQGL